MGKQTPRKTPDLLAPRSFESLKDRGQEAFGLHGVQSLRVESFTTPNAEDAAILEQAFLWAFQELYLQLPRLNSVVGKHRPWDRVSRDRIVDYVQAYEK